MYEYELLFLIRKKEKKTNTKKKEINKNKTV